MLSKPFLNNDPPDYSSFKIQVEENIWNIISKNF